MTVKVPNQSGAWSTAAIWDTCTIIPTLHASTNITITNTDNVGLAFTAPNTTNACTGALVYCAAVGTLDWVLTLQESTVDTVAVATIPAADRVAGAWLYFRFATPYVFTTTGASAYRFKLRTASSDTGSAAAWATGAAIAAYGTDNRTGVPANTDDVLILGQNGTTPITVTVDGSQTIGAGNITTLPTARGVLDGLRVERLGILDWDTVASATLTLKGNLVISEGGEVHMGTVSVPYPTTKVAKLTFNPTANGNHGIVIFGTGKLIGQGEAKTSTALWKTKYVSGVGTAADPLIVSGSVDWAVGDEIIISATSNNAANYNESENKFIITKNSATSYVLSNTVGGAEAALTYTHTTDAWVLNLQRNVIINTNNAARAWYFYSISTTCTVDLDWVRFEYMGYSSTAGKLGFLIPPSTTASCDYCVNYAALNNAFMVTSSTAIQQFTGLIVTGSTATDVATGSFLFTSSGNKTLVDCFAVKNANYGFNISSSSGLTTSRCHAISCATGNAAGSGAGFYFSVISSSIFIDCESHCNKVYGTYFANGNVLLMLKSFISGTKGYNTTADIYIITGSYNNVVFDSSVFGSPAFITNYLLLSSGSEFLFHRLNNTDNNHRWYNNYGSAQSTGAALADTTVRTPNSLAVRLAPEDGTTGFTWSFNIYANANNITYFFGFFRKNAAFGTNIATVELWLPGASSASASVNLSNITDEWQPVALSVFNTNNIDGLATIKVKGITSTASAYLYADDFYNAGDTVVTYDKVTGLDNWYQGKPVQIIAPQILSVADIWTFSTTLLTANDTTGKLLNDIGIPLQSTDNRIPATIISTSAEISALSDSISGVAIDVRTELTPELTKINNNLTPTQANMLLEMYNLLGLDPTIPLVVKLTERKAGDITQSISTNTTTKTTTVTRI